MRPFRSLRSFQVAREVSILSGRASMKALPSMGLSHLGGSEELSQIVYEESTPIL